MSSTPLKAFQWDLARQVERLDFLLPLLPRYAAWGYAELYLHLGDAVHYPSLPGVARDDAYTFEQLGELVLAAARAGIRVVPIANLLGHTQYLLKHPEWRDLNELRDERGRPRPHGQICPLHPRTAEVAEKLLGDLAPYCTAGKIHVGLDESFHLGQCPRCREEVAQAGLAAHFAGHVRRLHAQAARHSLTLGLWADMLHFIPAAIPLLPRGSIAYDWYYYPFGKLPRVELFNFAERDLATPLKQHGIAYYGCPMNGAFRHEPLPVFGDRLGNIRSWWRRCNEVQAEGFLVTSWEPSRLALETTILVDAAAAGLWLEPGIDDATTLLAAGIKRTFRVKKPRELARTLLAADEHAFTGYARWQINDRWNVFAGNESLAPYEADARFFRRLLARNKTLPRPLAASLEFRHYLAQRDWVVRRGARAVFAIRRHLARAHRELALGFVTRLTAEADQLIRTLRRARRAARVMWSRSRDPRVSGPNEQLLQADVQRLAEWRSWLRRAVRQPEIAWVATPLGGAWQLQFWVHNFAPAAQRVVVEQRQPDGVWRELAGRYTLEFRAAAARPDSRMKREFTVPLEGRDARLRVSVHGIGQVAISHAALTNGVARLPLQPTGSKLVVGRKALRQGVPQAGYFDAARALRLQKLRWPRKKKNGPAEAGPLK